MKSTTKRCAGHVTLKWGWDKLIRLSKQFKTREYLTILGTDAGIILNGFYKYRQWICDVD